MTTEFREEKTTIEHKKELIMFMGGAGGFARVVSELQPDFDHEGNKILVFVLSVNNYIKKRYQRIITSNQCDAHGRPVNNIDEGQVIFVKMKYPEIYCPAKYFNLNFDTVYRPCFVGFDNEEDINTWYPKMYAMENSILKQMINSSDTFVNVLSERNQNLIELSCELARRENQFNKILRTRNATDEESSENKQLEDG